MVMHHVAQISETLFWVYSHEAEYKYIVNIEDKSRLSEAMEIAEREATRWGGPDEEELGEDYDYYYNEGYVAVVENAFASVGIDAIFYTEMEKSN